jgi:hypothetical protein
MRHCASSLEGLRRTILFSVGSLLFMSAAHAVPSFARQTGLDCTSCHLSFPELTPTGRLFKLSGYTLGDRRLLPVAGMLQISRTSTASVDATQQDQFPKDRQVVLQQASLFVAGKITDGLGLFSQWTYDGVAHRGAIDNVDLRFARRLDGDGDGMIYGVTLNNNPGVQDVYNTSAAWRFPYASSSVAIVPNAGVAVEGLGQQVAGLGGYVLWHRLVYAEVSTYRTADKVYSTLRAATDKTRDVALRGGNPYWRVALQHEWDSGAQTAEIGAYGFSVHQFPDNMNPNGPTDDFRDIAIDTQYQYVTDRHRWSAQLNVTREHQSWNATPQSNPGDRLTALNVKGTYYFQKKYGLNLAHFATRGDTDATLYDTGSPITGSALGSPNSAGYVVELNYLPLRDTRIAVQYTAYTKFNGASSNYDGLGRNARDNNTLYLLGWLMF